MSFEADFKFNVTHNKQVKHNFSKRQRSLCAQLRSGTLAERPTGLMPEEDGLMNKNDIHFMFCCTAYDDIRDVLFSQMFFHL